MTTIKRTTVYISIGDKTQVFRSPEEIPAPLRKRLVRSTRGMNSATILIADRGGREEIRKIIAGQPSPLKSRLRGDYFQTATATQDEEKEMLECELVEESTPYTWRDWDWKHWVEMLLPVLAGIALWFIFTWNK